MGNRNSLITSIWPNRDLFGPANKMHCCTYRCGWIHVLQGKERYKEFLPRSSLQILFIVKLTMATMHLHCKTSSNYLAMVDTITKQLERMKDNRNSSTPIAAIFENCAFGHSIQLQITMNQLLVNAIQRSHFQCLHNRFWN